MRFGPVMLVWGVCLAGALDALAHPADEFPQVTVQVAIDDERVSVLSRIPASHASRDLFDGASPIELDRIEPVELAERMQPLIAGRCPLSIDGLVVPPTVRKAEMRMTGSRLPVRSFSERQAMDRGYLIFVAEYETKGKPRRVDLDWTVFANEYDERGEPIHAEADLSLVALLLGYGRESFAVLSPIEPGLTWHSDEAFALPAGLLASEPVRRSYTRLPVLSIAVLLLGLGGAFLMAGRSKPAGVAVLLVGLVAGGLLLPIGNYTIEHTSPYAALSEDEAIAVFESLHRNIYRAFDYTDEGAVYDALAQSVDGPMLETIYNEVYESLIMREENGAVSKVARVEIEEVELIDRFDSDRSAPADEEPGSYVVRASWQVDGVVTHFRHSHARTNAFEAVYTVAPRAGGWRIVESRVLRQRRVDDGWRPAEGGSDAS